MGYTHYWKGQESQIDREEWPKAIADCEKFIAAKEKALNLDREFNDDTWLAFNGDESKGEGHETFLVAREVDRAQAERFEFCKTARKPYDIVVTACLARLAEAGLKVSSDGYEDEEEWQDGLRFAADVLGRPVAYPVERD